MYRRGIILFLLLLSFQSFSGEVLKPEDVKRIRKKISISFDEELVYGNFESSELSMISAKKSAKYKKLIKIRENFLPEIEENGAVFKGR